MPRSRPARRKRPEPNGPRFVVFLVVCAIAYGVASGQLTWIAVGALGGALLLAVRFVGALLGELGQAWRRARNWTFGVRVTRVRRRR